jgi:general secretion pathway protein F/type IV pilus assembly protein PilC
LPNFNYTARDPTGQKLSGTIAAGTRREALAMLCGQALFPIEVAADAPRSQARKVRHVPAQMLSVMYGQLADLLRSGVPLLRALAMLQKQGKHAGLKMILEDVHHQVEEGTTLAEAMARFQHVFGEMPISMVRAGSEGGFLEEVLTRVAQFTETQDDLKKRTVGALAYPMFLAVVGGAVVTTLIVFFVPKFEDLFAQLRERHELPWATEWMLGLSAGLRDYGLWIVAGLAVVALLIVQQMRTERGQLWWDGIRMRLPLVGPILLNLAVARFCRVLGTLLRNGVPILRSLEISSGATGNRVLAAAIGRATENISAGQPLAGPLAASGHFPELVVEMIAVAEQANNLENVLLDIADTMERRTWRRLELAVRLLEPLMLLVMAAIVLVVVIALLLPVLKMSSALK